VTSTIAAVRVLAINARESATLHPRPDLHLVRFNEL